MAGYIGSKTSVVSSGVERKKTYSITGSTTSLTGLNYTVGKVHVYQNGVRLLDGTDYTATNGTSITLTVAAQSGDNVVVVSQASFQLSESYTSTESDARYVQPTHTGNLDITGTVTSDGLTVDGAYSQSKASGTFFTLTDTTNSKTGYINWDSGNWSIFTHGPYKRLNIADNGDISFYEDTGTTAKFFWDASAERLGIGTSSPDYNLVINDSSGPSIRLDTNTAAENASLIMTESSGTSGSNGGFIRYSGSDNRLELGVGTSWDNTRMVINRDTGNVGINETSPFAKLHISDTQTGRTSADSVGNLLVLEDDENGMSILSANAGAGYILFGDQADTAAGGIVYDHSADRFRFRTGSTWDRMIIDSSGNVGIGTSSITNESDHHKLKIAGASGSGAGIIEFADSSNNIDGAIFADGGNLFIVADRDNATADSSIRFRVDGSAERMRIDSSGRVTMPYQPAVCAYPTGGTVASGDQTLLSFDNTLFNNGNHFNTTTKIFTAPVAGYYFASANVRWETQSFVQNSYIRLFISKNDGSYNSTRIHVINGNNEAWSNYMGMSCSGVVQCSAGDTIRVKGGMNGGTSEIHGESSFNVYLLG